MSWLLLILSGLFEVAGIVFLKEYSLRGNKIFMMACILAFSASFISIYFVLRFISMSVAYAVWTGIGAIGGVLVGVYRYKESKHPLKLFFIALILFSVLMLKFIN